MAALLGLLGAGSLVHFYLLSHRELDIHSEKCICYLLDSINVVRYEIHF